MAERFGYNGKENNPELGLDWYDFGARNYEASLGRWMNIDPLGEQYENWSPYSSVMNNPIFFVDPDGKQITVHYINEDGKRDQLIYNYGDKYEGDNSFLKDVFESFDYLIDNDLGDVLEDVAGRKENVDLKKGLFLRDVYYNPEEKEIRYNPNSGVRFEDGGEQPPAIGLLHELSHAQKDLENPDEFDRLSNTPDENYTTKEEKRVIENVENPASLKMNLPTRNNHRGNRYKTASSTTTLTRKEVKEGIQNESRNQAFKDHKKAMRKQESIIKN